MQFVIETHRKAFEHREFIEKDPLRLYTIAWVCGFEDEVAYVARNAEQLTVTRRSCISDLKGLTLDAYYRLVSFLADRDNEWHRPLENIWIPKCYGLYESQMVESLYRDIEKILRRPYLRADEVYLIALEGRSRCEKAGCSWYECPFIDREIKKFIEKRIKEREALYNKLQPAKWYCERTTSLHPDPLIEMILIRFT